MILQKLDQSLFPHQPTLPPELWVMINKYFFIGVLSRIWSRTEFHRHEDNGPVVSFSMANGIHYWNSYYDCRLYCRMPYDRFRFKTYAFLGDEDEDGCRDIIPVKTFIL